MMCLTSKEIKLFPKAYSLGTDFNTRDGHRTVIQALESFTALYTTIAFPSQKFCTLIWRKDSASTSGLVEGLIMSHTPSTQICRAYK